MLKDPKLADASKLESSSCTEAEMLLPTNCSCVLFCTKAHGAGILCRQVFTKAISSLPVVKQFLMLAVHRHQHHHFSNGPALNQALGFNMCTYPNAFCIAARSVMLAQTKQGFETKRMGPICLQHKAKLHHDFLHLQIMHAVPSKIPCGCKNYQQRFFTCEQSQHGCQ